MNYKESKNPIFVSWTYLSERYNELFLICIINLAGSLSPDPRMKDAPVWDLREIHRLIDKNQKYWARIFKD